MIGLVDGNNFYVSCERIFDPSLEGKPVAVLSNNDGCVISRSQECKELGIAMGAAGFQLKPRLAQIGLILKSSNYELYGDISRRVIAVLGEFSPEVEQYSIDEAFIHLNLPAGTEYFEYGTRIRQAVLKWIGIPCGVGFAPSKTLAKIANHIGKKLPSGVFVMPEEPRPVLEELPVGEVWGVGRRLAPKLASLGIRTAWQLAAADEGSLRSRVNVTLAKTALELRGEPLFVQENPEELSKSISCSRSFGYPVVELSELSEAVAHYTAQAAEKLRREKQSAAGANVYFQYYPEYTPVARPGGWSGTTVTFEVPTFDTAAMLRAIRPKLRGIFLPGRRYKKAGIMFFGLESAAIRQPDLFSKEDREKSDQLSMAVDEINRRFGRGSVFHLAEGVKKTWKMKREMLSPSYTTNWEQLPVVK
ncbi:Y-family DNA polymerase [uncultured Victivallis sp.]|uniref:Y-family DNA polymerase n=1 Tax=uncultured Victivallis sp. TaxID=354118 RepID=UPI0025E8A2AB|nr:Y-family DNA polymerase [uncultured Victivallis sp.]